MTNRQVRQVSCGLTFVQGAPKALVLTGVCLAVLAAWQPRYGAADAAASDHAAASDDAAASDNAAASDEAAASANAVVGAWDGPFCWPIMPVHLAHLPPSGESETTGRVLIWDATGASTLTTAWLWTPRAGCFDNYPHPDPDCFTQVENNNATNLFCAGQTALADGTILTAGGHNGPCGANLGLPDTNHFIRDPLTGEWGEWKTLEDGIPNMAEPRWYPTVITLPDGHALTVSGSDQRCSNNNLVPCCNDGSCQGNCNEPQGVPGCDNPECEATVCGQDPFCCDIAWDQICADEAIMLCFCVDFINEIPETYDPAANPLAWTQLAVQTDTPFYPFNFVLPNGKVLYAGAEGPGGGTPSVLPTQTYVLDFDAVTWTEVPNGNSSIPGGSAVMFEPGKVLKSGGGAPAVEGAAVFDATVGEQDDWEWTDVAPMQNKRRRHQLTMLPDGTILATGGTRSAGQGIEARHNREYASICDGGTNDGLECSIPGLPPGVPDCPGYPSGRGCPVECVRGVCDGGPDDGMPCPPNGCADAECMQGEQLWVATAEIYDPDDNMPTWMQMADMKTPRMYHSTALLLPDGRVLSGGGGPRGFGRAIHSYPTVEFFSPPYYFKERPEITFAPDAICYGSTFRVASSDAVDVDTVTLIRLGTVTHSFDSDQRFLELDTSQVDNQLDVVAPENANDAPPGYYMLFVLSEDEDVPSVGEYVLVAESFCEPLSQGYWHRQCLGVPASQGGIDPGNGQGPQEPTEPGFVEGLMPCADDRLADLGFDMTTCQGMDADPPNDPCERARKQFTALILNVCSGKLTECCEVDVGAEGCASTNVGDLIDEIAGLIQGGSCNTASQCAAAVNEGDVPDNILDLLILLDSVDLLEWWDSYK